MRNKIICCISTVILALVGLLPTRSLAAPGDLDPTFGTGGRVFTRNFLEQTPDGNPGYPVVSSTVVQPDGKILVCGSYWEDAISEYYGQFILRYLPDGRLDPSFGEGGRLLQRQDYLYALGMALQPDGKIVLIGSRVGSTVIFRYTSSGMVDNTFASFGNITVPGNAFGEGYSLSLQPDGKIVGVGGEYGFAFEDYASVLFRLNPNGYFDQSFGPAGTGIIRIEHGWGRDSGLVQPDGKILVIGAQELIRFGPIDGLLARYNPNGTPDSTFGTNGIVRPRIANLESQFYGAALQPDGKIVLVGAAFEGETGDVFVARFNLNGSYDTGFGANGVLNLNHNYIYPGKVVVKEDGTIIIFGNVFDARISQLIFATIRLRPNGFIDPGFGIGGRSLVPMNIGGTNYAYLSDGAIQPDGKIVAAGYFTHYITDSHEYAALMRIDGGISAPATQVSVSGRVVTPGGRGISRVRLTFVDDVGNTRYTQTNPFGYYRFPAVTASLNYTLNIASKSYTFPEPTRTLFVTTNLADVDFVANP